MYYKPKCEKKIAAKLQKTHTGPFLSGNADFVAPQVYYAEMAVYMNKEMCAKCLCNACNKKIEQTKTIKSLMSSDRTMDRCDWIYKYI